MKVVKKDVEGLYTEQRTYDDDGKLVDIRKIYPAGTAPTGVKTLSRRAGVVGD